MVGVYEWITPSQNGLTHQLLGSIWANLHSTETIARVTMMTTVVIKSIMPRIDIVTTMAVDMVIALAPDPTPHAATDACGKFGSSF